MSTANLGILAGLPPEQIEADIRQVNPGRAGQRPGEIPEAIRKALADCGGGSYRARTTYRPPPRPAPAMKDGQAALRAIIDQGEITNDTDLRDASPVRLLDDPKEFNPAILMETLYGPLDSHLDRRPAGNGESWAVRSSPPRRWSNTIERVGKPHHFL